MTVTNARSISYDFPTPDGLVIITGPKPPPWWRLFARLLWCIRNRRLTQERRTVHLDVGWVVCDPPPERRAFEVRMPPSSPPEVYGDLSPLPPAWLPTGPKIVNRHGMPTRWAR